MPDDPPGATPQIVIGDRYGRSASSRLVERLVAVVEGAGFRCARNAPYAGGYTLDRHGRPAGGSHAAQVEIDRSLYLLGDRREIGPGARAVATLLARMVVAMADELAAAPPAIAAE